MFERTVISLKSFLDYAGWYLEDDDVVKSLNINSKLECNELRNIPYAGVVGIKMYITIKMILFWELVWKFLLIKSLSNTYNALTLSPVQNVGFADFHLGFRLNNSQKFLHCT